MKQSIGLLEWKSIAKGIEATDAMVKAGDVALILSTPTCPGKYISLISGGVGAVQNAVEAGKRAGSIYTIESAVIPHISPEIFPALTATLEVDRVLALGIVETLSAITAIVAGDTALKAAQIELLEIRLARGLGGKGFVIFTGDVAAVKQAARACENQLALTGSLVSAVVIPAPDRGLISKLV